MSVALFEANAHFRPFPDPEEVFADRVALHRELLLPLAVLDLSFVDPTLEGTIHFIHPIEPDDGCVGEGGDAAFTYLCRESWVAYRYDGARCSVTTAFDYFSLPRFRKLVSEPAADSDSPRLRLARKRAAVRLSSLEAHYDAMRARYEDRRCHFLEHGALHHAGAPCSDENRVKLAELGGPSWEGNWSSTDFPLVLETVGHGPAEEPAAYPLTEDGRRFRYIGSIDAYEYTLTHGCQLLLFFDPDTRTALTTFDWS